MVKSSSSSYSVFKRRGLSRNSECLRRCVFLPTSRSTRFEGESFSPVEESGFQGHVRSCLLIGNGFDIKWEPFKHITTGFGHRDVNVAIQYDTGGKEALYGT